MRELNSVEVQSVSGAGIITDIGATMGQGIGSIVEIAGKPGAAQAGMQLGASIGAIVESAITAISSLFGGLFGRK